MRAPNIPDPEAETTQSVVSATKYPTTEAETTQSVVSATKYLIIEVETTHSIVSASKYPIIEVETTHSVVSAWNGWYTAKHFFIENGILTTGRGIGAPAALNHKLA